MGEEGLMRKVFIEFLLVFVEKECLILIFFFRVELVIGGFVVKEISFDLFKCFVIYIICVDLKGEWFLCLLCSKFVM